MIPLLRLVGCWRTGVASENRPASQKAGKSQAPKHLNKQRRTTLPLDRQRHPFCTKPTPPPLCHRLRSSTGARRGRQVRGENAGVVHGEAKVPAQDGPHVAGLGLASRASLAPPRHSEDTPWSLGHGHTRPMLGGNPSHTGRSGSFQGRKRGGKEIGELCRKNKTAQSDFLEEPLRSLRRP